jgi:hypothetical protein
MTNYDSKDFLSLISELELPSVIKKGIVNERVVLRSPNFQIRQLTIKEFVFNQDVIFDNVGLGKGISFESCIFKGALIFKKCFADDTPFNFPDILSNVYFNNCKLSEFSMDGLSHLPYGIIFLGCSVSNGFFVSFLTTLHIKSLRILNTTIEGRCELNHLNIVGAIEFHNSNIRCSIRCENIFADELVIRERSLIENFVHLIGGTLKTLKFSNCTFTHEVILDELNIIESFYVNRVDSKRVIQYTTPSEMESNMILSNGLYITQSKFGNQFELHGSNRRISRVHITCSLDQSGTIRLNYCLISQCYIMYDNHSSNLIFNFCRFSELKFDHFTNTGNLNLTACRPIENEGSSIVMYNSDMGKTSLFNMDLNEFTWFEIVNSNICDLSISNVKWFNADQLSVGNYQERLLARKRETYRQLKQVCEKNGDRIQALDFKSEELKTFNEIVKESRSWFHNDSLILRLSQTNDFGLNWKKPLCHIILITITIYPLVVISGSEELLCMPANSFEEVKKTLIIVWNKHSVLWQIFNPARLTFRMFPEVKELNGWTHFFDNIHRLILAFYIVQIVSAFRKYIK